MVVCTLLICVLVCTRLLVVMVVFLLLFVVDDYDPRRAKVPIRLPATGCLQCAGRVKTKR